MRNETLKNLLLTASLISASAFLTACGDSSSSPSAETPSKDLPSQTEQAAIDAAAALADAEAKLAAAKASGDQEAIDKAQAARDAAAEEARLAKESKENAEAAEAENKLKTAAAEAEKQRQEAAEQARRDEIQRLAEEKAALLKLPVLSEADKAFQIAFVPALEDFSNILREETEKISRIKYVSKPVNPLKYRELDTELDTLAPLVDKAQIGEEVVSVLRAKLEAAKLAFPAAPALDAETPESTYVAAARKYVKTCEKHFTKYKLSRLLYNTRLKELTALRDQYEFTLKNMETTVGNLLTAVSGDDLQKGVVSALTSKYFKAGRHTGKSYASVDMLLSFNAVLAKPATKDKVLQGNRKGVVEDLLSSVPKQATTTNDAAGEAIATYAQLDKSAALWKLMDLELDPKLTQTKDIELAPGIRIPVVISAEGTSIVAVPNAGPIPLWEITFKDGSKKKIQQGDHTPVTLSVADGKYHDDVNGLTLMNTTTHIPLYSDPLQKWSVVRMYEADDTALTIYGQAVKNLLDAYLKDHPAFIPFWNDDAAAASGGAALGLSAKTARGISESVSLRAARLAANGSANLAGFKMNGVVGQTVDLGLPLFVQLKGDVTSAKATEATTCSVAYRLGNTVIGAIQGYANSGAGFEADSRQLETSIVASQSFGSFFIEGQIGSVSATEVHGANWSGVRSQLTLGLDYSALSPFVQLTHRQLDRSGLVDLNETTAYVGLDMEVAKLAADTYSIDTRLLAKAGYGSKDWSAGSKALGSTTGFSGCVEWSASLNLNSGVAFSSNLALDTVAGSSAGLTVSLDR